MLFRPTTPRILHRLYQCFAVIVSVLMIFPPSLLLATTTSSGPDWWAERQVIASNGGSDDYAALNQGQLKNLATKAAQAMEVRLSGGAGTDILNMVNAWSQPAAGGVTRDDYAVVTLGQLKAVALPFYQRLQAAGLITAADYAWATSTNSPDNAAVANLGQAKHLFSFALPQTPKPDPEKEDIIDPNPEGTITNPSGSYPPSEYPQIPQGSAPAIENLPVINPVIAIGEFFYMAEPPFPNGFGIPSYRPDLINMRSLTGSAELKDTKSDDCILLAEEYQGPGAYFKVFPDALDNYKIYDLNVNFTGLDVMPHAQSYKTVYSTYDFHNSLVEYRQRQKMWQDPVDDPSNPLHIFDSHLNATGRVVGANADYTPLPGEQNEFVELSLIMDYQKGFSSVPLNIRPGEDDPKLTGTITIKTWPEKIDWLTYSVEKTDGNSISIEENSCPICSDPGVSHALSHHGLTLDPANGHYFAPHVKAFDFRKVGGQKGLEPGKRYYVEFNVELELPTFNGGFPDDTVWKGVVKAMLSLPPNSIVDMQNATGGEIIVAKDLVELKGDMTFNATNDPTNTTTVFSMAAQGEFIAGKSSFPAEITAPVDEASGARYRKIALNGQPMPDEKPQTTPETDQHPEETFIDALTLQLRHQTTDAYLAVPGSDLTIQVRRNATSEEWNHRYGLRPWERRDLPFGVSWSSNLSPNIRFVSSAGTAKNPPDVPTAIVTDEQGANYRFLKRDDGTYFPFPTAKHEQATYLCSLEKVGEQYVFTKKFGTKLVFATIVESEDVVPADRMVEPFGRMDTYRYARLVSVTDRLGNRINYDYTNRKADALIPSKIYVANRPDLKIDIQISNDDQNSHSLVTDIWDATGYRTSYHYTTLRDGIRSLTRIVHADGTETTYGYDMMDSENDQDGDPDQRPKDSTEAVPDPQYYHFHCDLSLIKDLNGNIYRIEYQLDKSRWEYVSQDGSYYQKTGIPRNVLLTVLPDDTGAEFRNNSIIKCYSSGTAEDVTLNGESRRQTLVTNAQGHTRTYTWTDPDVAVVKVPPSLAAKSPTLPNPIIIYYKTLTVDMPGNLGQETFTFNPDAGLALASATDLSGNTTTFTYTDGVPTAAAYNGNFEGKKPIGAPENQQTVPVYLNRFFDDPTSQINALGLTKAFTYNAQRILKSVTDELGRYTEYTIDTLGRRTEEKIYSDTTRTQTVQETSFEYDDSRFPGFITQKTVKKRDAAPTGEGYLIVRYHADDYGRVAQEIVSPGNGIPDQITSYIYNLSGDKLTVTNPRGHTTAFHYDQRHRLTGVSYPNNTRKEFEYDARGNKTKEIDERRKVTQFKYDALNRVISTTREMENGANIVTSQTYSPINTVTSTTDANGNTTTLRYDVLGRLISTTTPPAPIDAGSIGTAALTALTTTFEYGANAGGSVFATTPAKPTKTTDPRGFVTEVIYDKLYRLTKTKVQYSDGLFATTETKYDAVGNPTEVKDPLGYTTITTYDALNRPTRVTNPDNTYTEAYYTSTGLNWKTVDELGRVTRQEFDGAGRPVKTILPAPTPQDPSPTLTTEYDPNGNVAATIDPLGRRTEFVYDARNRKTRDILPEIHDVATNTLVSPRIKTEYDAVGNVVRVTDARGNVTETTYDNANRPVEVKAPQVSVWTTASPSPQDLRPTVSTTYDPNGNVLTVTNANGQVTSNVYDALNRLTSTTDPEGITVEYTYDATGNKTSVKDGNGHVTRFTYDGLNRNLATIDPAGNAVAFAYNALNKVSQTDSQGRVTTYAYDARHRVTDTSYGAGHPDNLHYTYDNVGNLLSVTTPNDATGLRNVGYTYDNLSRVITESSGNGSNLVTHHYVYDLIGNRTHTTYGGTSRSLASTYDAHNRLLTLTESDRTTTYGYDRAGNRVRLELPNGDATEYTYDSLNRAVEIHTAHDRHLLQNYVQNYDALGNVTRITETYADAGKNRTVVNTYDNNSRLIREQVSGGSDTAYTYDDGNNRTQKAVNGITVTNYTYNELNQLTEFTDSTGTTTYTYDLDGNRTERQRNNTDITTYTYDRENRLVALDATRSRLNAAYAYKYDYRTRRILRTEGNTSTRVVFSGGTAYSEHPFDITTHILSAPDVENIRGSDYGGGIGGILYTLRPNAQDPGPARIASYTHYNSRGDVTAKTDDSGGLTYQAAYEAFGTRTSESGNTQDRQKANTKDEDPTGLLNEGFRYRDLETGTFITRDPLGFVDGPNMYAYVVQNPWSKFDPLGLSDSDYNGTYLEKGHNAYADSWFGSAHRWTLDLGISIIGVGNVTTIDSGLNNANHLGSIGVNSPEMAIARIRNFQAVAEPLAQESLKGESFGNMVQLSGGIARTRMMSGFSDEALQRATLVSKSSKQIAKQTEEIVENIPKAESRLTRNIAENESQLAKAGEDLFIGTYNQVRSSNIKFGLNATHTPHHVVQAAVSNAPSRGTGIAINIRKDIHELTRTFKKPVKPAPDLRTHLARDIRDLRSLLSDSGYDNSTVNIHMKELIRKNKELGGFEKK